MEIKLSVKPFSANKMYTGRKKRSVWYSGFSAKVHKMLEKGGYKYSFKKGTPLTLVLVVGYSYAGSDTSNAIKPVEDCISRYFGFNDNLIYSIHIRKYIVKKGEEFLYINLKKFRGEKRATEHTFKRYTTLK